MTFEHPFGRIDDDGTVYVRTGAGERAVGSWQAGAPEAGLAHFERRFQQLVTEVDLLGQRLAAGTSDPAALRDRAGRLRAELATANVVGDLDRLDRRLGEISEKAQERAAVAAGERAARRAEAAERLRGLAEEAEALAASTEWKIAGERLRGIVDDWKAVRGVDRRIAGELWRRFAAARDEFHRRRGTHFAALDESRRAAQAAKEALVTEAETLATSTDWSATAARFRELLATWKSSGRAARGADDALWTRFRTAQQTFFDGRSSAFAERDTAARGHLARKHELLAEAEALDSDADPAGARRRLRELQRAWDEVGPVPRDARAGLERRLSAAAERVRAAADVDRSPGRPGSPLLERLRESVAKLERRAERARAAGRPDEAAEAEEALATQREWLARAENG